MLILMCYIIIIKCYIFKEECKSQFNFCKVNDLLVGMGESEELVKEVASLRARLESMEEEIRSREATIDELENQLQRARADDQRDKIQVRMMFSVHWQSFMTEED